MSKKLVVREEVFEYPDTGDINYGEEATGWAEEITDIAAEISGPGDIPTTEVVLTGTLNGDFVEGNVTGLNFDTSFVQRILVEGFITRNFVGGGTPTRVESFVIEGAYNGSVFNITTEFSGDDCEVEFDTNGGQLTFSYLNIAGTDEVRVKYKAKAIIDESFFE
jgi:hypothetical protein